MAKDPAFLFYDGDAARDVSHLNRLERGCYFDLIQAQRKFGRLNLELIKKILGKDFLECWEQVKICLTYDNDMYFIEWLENSTNKRKAYSESRSKNRTGSKSAQLEKTYVNHMENANENVIEDVFKDRGVGKGFFTPDEKYEIELPEMDIGKAIEYITHTKHVSATKELVSGLWGAFKVKNFTGEKTYKNDRDIIRHFFESLKFVTINGKQQHSKSDKAVGRTIELDQP